MADLNSYLVDEAGYAISTHTSVKCAAEALAQIADQLRPGADISSVFGGDLTREDFAASLEAQAQSLLKTAERLRAPQVDERDDPRVGADAAHSVRPRLRGE